MQPKIPRDYDLFVCLWAFRSKLQLATFWNVFGLFVGKSLDHPNFLWLRGPIKEWIRSLWTLDKPVWRISSQQIFELISSLKKCGLADFFRNVCKICNTIQKVKILFFDLLDIGMCYQLMQSSVQTNVRKLICARLWKVSKKLRDDYDDEDWVVSYFSKILFKIQANKTLNNELIFQIFAWTKIMRVTLTLLHTQVPYIPHK